MDTEIRKYLIVGEYSQSYTGGSVVFIDTDGNLCNLVFADGLKIVTDEFNIFLRALQMELDFKIDGINQKEFWEYLYCHNYTDAFINKLREIVGKPGDRFYPGFHNGNIRVDWLGDVLDGVYIVFRLEVDSTEISRIISDTYYCA